VDESCLGTPQRAGFEGLIRNSVGRYLFGFSGFISNSEDILFAELSAIYHGLSLARDMHIAELVCYKTLFYASVSLPVQPRIITFMLHSSKT